MPHASQRSAVAALWLQRGPLNVLTRPCACINNGQGRNGFRQDRRLLALRHWEAGDRLPALHGGPGRGWLRPGRAPGTQLCVCCAPRHPVNTEPRKGQVAGPPVALNAISKGVYRCDSISTLTVFLGKRRNSCVPSVCSVKDPVKRLKRQTAD